MPRSKAVLNASSTDDTTIDALLSPSLPVALDRFEEPCGRVLMTVVPKVTVPLETALVGSFIRALTSALEASVPLISVEPVSINATVSFPGLPLKLDTGWKLSWALSGNMMAEFGESVAGSMGCQLFPPSVE